MDTLRWVSLEDAAAIHPLFFATEAWESFLVRFTTWLQWQERGRIVYLLAEREGQLAGQGQLFLGPGTQGEIANVQVAAAYQNKGIGTTILNYLIHYAQTQACASLEIRVAMANSRAQALYQRLGFTVDRPLHSAYDEAGVVMKMVIEANNESIRENSV